MIEHLPNHETGGGFAVSASNTDDAKVFGGPVVFNAGGDCLGIMIGENGLVVEREFFKEFFHAVNGNVLEIRWDSWRRLSWRGRYQK